MSESLTDAKMDFIGKKKTLNSLVYLFFMHPSMIYIKLEELTIIEHYGQDLPLGNVVFASV